MAAHRKRTELVTSRRQSRALRKVWRTVVLSCQERRALFFPEPSPSRLPHPEGASRWQAWADPLAFRAL